MFMRDLKQKHYEPAYNAICDFVGKNFFDQIKKHCHKMSPLTQLDAGGDKEFFQTVNPAYQILTNNAR